jgi:5-methylcytosine-specific restriction endonuclease McrA|tara:strand:- start:264 stop:635 length:372 start_codon:yes stop_codon:yes gene_type:complete
MPYASKIKHNQHCRDYRKRMPLSVRIKLRKSHAIRKKKHLKFMQKILRRYKVFKGCLICGYNKHHSALEFDHINRAIKIANISEIVKKNYAFRRVKHEVRKCNVLCSNCHRIKTFENKEWLTL